MSKTSTISPSLPPHDPETGEVFEPKKTITTRRPYERKRVTKNFNNDTRTQANFADECNINNIMAKYQKYGVIDAVQNTEGRFGDFTDIGDYHSAMNAITDAKQRFAELPSSIRKRFGNDPAALLEFLQDEENIDEAIKLGLIVAQEPASQESAPDKGASVIGGSDPADPEPAASAAS